MLSAISQIKTNQPYNIPKRNISFRKSEAEIAEKKDVLIKEKPTEATETQYKFLFNFLLSTIAIGAIVGLFITGGKNKNLQSDNITKTIFKFESLQDNKEIPTIENCKSLNKNLKNLLNQQIKIESADKELLEEVGHPDASNRFILSGPTGVGKTYFSKVYAKSLKADYIEILFSDLNSRWAGEVEDKMKSMFQELTDQAKNNPNKKFVVTFNEIDALLSPIEHLTGGNGSTHFASLRRERSVFLTHIEKLQQDAPNVTVIGTTNMLPSSKNLDNATVGRFQNIIEVPYPDKDSLYEAIKMGIEKIKNNNEFIAENDDKLKELANTMAERKFSFRNLDFIINEAKSNYLRDKIDDKNITFKFDYLKQAQESIKHSDGEREHSILG